jgi:hypothetical protein
MKIPDFLLMAGHSLAASRVDVPQKVGFKKSLMHPKKYAKRKRRLKITGRSRNINHKNF